MLRTCLGIRDTCPSWWIVKFSSLSASHASNCLVRCATKGEGFNLMSDTQIRCLTFNIEVCNELPLLLIGVASFSEADVHRGQYGARSTNVTARRDNDLAITCINIHTCYAYSGRSPSLSSIRYPYPYYIPPLCPASQYHCSSEGCPPP